MKTLVPLSRSNHSFTDVVDHYEAKVESGELRHDKRQHRTLMTLSAVQANVEEYTIKRRAYESSMRTFESLKLQGEQKGEEGVSLESPMASPEAPQVPRGMYIWGEVGTGKTMMMDLLYETIPDSVPKRRVHFHKFCLDVHLRIHKFKQRLLAKYGRETNINLAPQRDAISVVAREIADESWLLCFDEFQVTDVADALIMTKLFRAIFSHGTVLITTSNRPPEDLYKNGLNRQYFLPFLTQLDQQCLTRNLGSTHDYREDSMALPGGHFTPLDDTSARALQASFEDACAAMGGGVGAPQRITVPVMMGRTLEVLGVMAEVGQADPTKENEEEGRGNDSSSAPRSVCRVSFDELCDTDKGAADYRALAAHFGEVYLTGVPVLSVLEHDKARRFITLIDEMYDAGRVLVWSAEKGPNALFRVLDVDERGEAENLGTDHTWATPLPANMTEQEEIVLNENIRGSQLDSKTAHFYTDDEGEEEVELSLLDGEISSVQELGFAFRRAASRLTEMSSKEWHARCGK